MAVSNTFAPTLRPVGLGNHIVQPGPGHTELSRQWARPAHDPRPELIEKPYAWTRAQPEIEIGSPAEVAPAVAAVIENPDPPPAAQTSTAATAWVSRARRNPTRRSKRAG